VFTLHRPSPHAIKQAIAAAARLSTATPQLLSLTSGLDPTRLPSSFAHDQSRTRIGQGQPTFTAAKRAFEHWQMFNLGWVRVANPEAQIAPGQIVAVEVQSLGLWTLNLSRIREVVNAPTGFGFLYATTPMHVEEGEERFLLEFDPATEEVFYHLEAISRPRNPLARIASPITRAFQHRFARDSHRRLRQALLQPGPHLS
jgi:uncharacterized protein (UPF0548 family)